jgi:hypothetical protein
MSVFIPTHPLEGLPPPFLTISGIPNFRDLGGWPISTLPVSSAPKSVRRHVIYRAAEPSQVTLSGIETLNKLHVQKIYDLRSTNEIERNKAAGRGGTVEWEGCERVFVPVFRDEDYSPGGIAKRFADYCDEGSKVILPLFLSYSTMHVQRYVREQSSHNVGICKSIY